MKSHIYGGTTVDPSTSANNFNWISATNLATWNTGQTNRDTVVPHALTLDQLRVVCATAPGSGKSYAYAIFQNGSITALTCTISNTATSAQDLTHSVSFAAGDTISIRATPTSTPTPPAGVYWSMRQDAAGLSAVIGGASQNAANGATNYNGLMSTASWNATENNVYSVLPTPGVLKNLYIMSSAAPGGVTDRTFEIWVNGATTGVKCSLGSAGTSANDTTHTVSVNAGDTVSIRSTVTGSPTLANIAWACSFAPTTDGESFLLYGDSAAPATGATNYEQPLGRASNAWNATESAVRMILAATTIKDMYVLLTTAPGGITSYTFTVRLNGSSTLATVPIVGAATTGNVLALSVTVADDDLLTLQSLPATSPAATTVKTGILLYIASNTTTTQTILGKARITISTLQTVLGRARITVSTLQTILGKSRITLITNKTITGIANIRSTTNRTILGVARVTKTTSQTILGKARIQETVNQTITGLSRVTVATSRTIQGLARITATKTQTISGLSRITSTTLRTILGKSRISVNTLKTLLGLARITLSVSRTILGKARVTISTLQTITGKSRITIITTKIIQGISRISTTTAQTILGKSRIGSFTTVNQTITGRSFIASLSRKKISSSIELSQISSNITDSSIESSIYTDELKSSITQI